MIAQNAQESGTADPISNGVVRPRTDAERQEIRKQLERILVSPSFHNSKRYSAVLQYLVHQTLQGFGDRLKERTIGIEVFNRPPDYDTGTDHAVRSAVAEVRKRLAQYYLQEAHAPLRIEIVPGSYIPQFRRVQEESPAVLSAAPAGVPLTVHTAALVAGAATEHRVGLRPLWLASACLILLACVVGLVMALRPAGPLETFWNPILSPHVPVLLCIGNVEGGKRPPDADPELSPTLTLREFHNSASETVNVYDAFTVAKFAGFIQAHGRPIQFASQSDATFTDLQKGPTILVGLLNNNWTERLVSRLRFTVEQSTPDQVTIRDRNNLSNQDWSINYATPYLNVTKDYALVLRMVDPKTEQMVVVAAGITVFGTTAAANFLISSEEMKKLAAVAPPGWQKKNMELVLSTDVIRGRSGPATIVASQFW